MREADVYLLVLWFGVGFFPHTVDLRNNKDSFPWSPPPAPAEVDFT